MDAVATNCTLAGNSAWEVGGGACSGTLDNCALAGNSAYFGGGAHNATLNHCILTGNSAYFGGGAHDTTLNSCILTGNSASSYGGGAYDGALINCSVVGNTASDYGGGTYETTLNNCIVYFNTAPADANYTSGYGGSLDYCCTTPQPTSGTGNITNAPLLVDQAGGNLRLQSSSPCINSGNNALVSSSFDLDGSPRVAGGTVDMGAHEFQTPASVLSYAWAQQYGLPTDGSADFVDTDGDHLNNWQEWRASTVPTNAASVLQMLIPASGVSGLEVSWQSVTNVTYFLERSTNLASQPAFSSLASNLVGQADTTSYTDTNATGSGPFFYRVGVQ